MKSNLKPILVMIHANLAITGREVIVVIIGKVAFRPSHGTSVFGAAHNHSGHAHIYSGRRSGRGYRGGGGGPAGGGGGRGGGVGQGAADVLG